MGKTLIISVLVGIMAGTLGYVAGNKYQPSQRLQFRNGDRSTQFPNRNSLGQGFRPVNGEILGVDETSMTVKLQDGSSKIIILTGITTYNKSTAAITADIKVGERVMVIGVQNSDGSVTAQDVQLNPVFRGIMATPSATVR